MDSVTYVITWMDGTQETYRGLIETRVADGELHMYEYTGVTRILKREWHFPLANIRVRTREQG